MIKKNIIANIIYFFALILATGCSGNSSFSTGAQRRNSELPRNPLSPGTASQDSRTNDATDTEIKGNEAGQEKELGSTSNLTADFTYGPLSSQSDFLIVFDNSVSMKGPAESVARGFESLAASKWPAGS